MVEFQLEAEGGKTRLRLVHSGFGAGADFDTEYDSTHGGWLTFLAALRFLVEVKRGVTGRHVCRLSMWNLPKAEAWDRLTRELGLAEQDFTPGSPYSVQIPGGGSFSGTVWAAPKPGYALLRVDEVDDSLLALVVEGAAAPCFFRASWYLYGAGATEEQPLLKEWDSFREHLTGGGDAATR